MLRACARAVVSNRSRFRRNAGATAVATAGYTRSMFLTLWSFFLVQALFVFIPGARAAVAPGSADIDPEDAFAQAHRSAESALRRLATRT